MLRFLILIAALAPSVFAEKRTWTSSDGERSFVADFVSREGSSVTLRRDATNLLRFDIAKLHEDDQRWLNLKHPVGDSGKGEPMPDAAAFFDTLKFGDSRDVVFGKLKESKIVEMLVEEKFFARVGFNGTFRTRHKIGGLYCNLFFDWTGGGSLTELTLQTDMKSAAEYDSVLRPCWEECVDLIIHLHGRPVQQGPIAKMDALEDGGLLATHLWRLETGGSILLGTAKSGGRYQVILRFTQENIVPNRIP